VPAAGRRDWEQFHNLRTLSTSIALEAAELMEHTQWATDADLPAIATQRREAIAEEIADVASLCCHPEPVDGYLAHDLGVDMEEAACLRQVNAPEVAKECGEVPRREGAGCGDEV